MNDQEAPPAVSRRIDLRTIVGFVVSAVAIAGCVWWASKQEAPTVPTEPAKLGLLVLAFGAIVIATFARCWRWDNILRFLRVDHERADAYGLTVVGYMGNTVLPARGGELLRVFLMAERSTALRREILGTIVTERLLDALILIVLFVGLALSGAGHAPGGDVTTVIAAALLVFAASGAYTYLRLRQAGRFESFADRIRPVARASRQLLTPHGALLFTVTAGIWLTEGVVFSLCAHSLGLEVSLLEALVVTVLASLSGLIPAGPGYIGTYDAGALFALHQVGVTGGAALSCVLLYRFIAFVPVTVAGLIIMLTRYGGLRGALRRERAAENAAVAS